MTQIPYDSVPPTLASPIPRTFSHFRDVTGPELNIEQIRHPQQPQHKLPLLHPQHSTCHSMSGFKCNSALKIAKQYHPKCSFGPPSSSTTTAADDSNHRSYRDPKACTRLDSPERSASREHSIIGTICSSSRRPNTDVVPSLNALSDIQSQIQAPPARPTLLSPRDSSSSSLPQSLKSMDLSINAVTGEILTSFANPYGTVNFFDQMLSTIPSWPELTKPHGDLAGDKKVIVDEGIPFAALYDESSLLVAQLRQQQICNAESLVQKQTLLPISEQQKQRLSAMVGNHHLLENASAVEYENPGSCLISARPLGLACLKVGQHLDSIGTDDREKLLSFEWRALEILDDKGDVSVSIVMALHLVGSANYNMKGFNDSLGFFNWANRILGEFDVRTVKHAVQLHLTNPKTMIGRREKTSLNLKRCLEFKKSILVPNSREMGIAYGDLAEAYVVDLNVKEAWSMCKKLLEIHLSQLGQNSMGVAHGRRLLGMSEKLPQEQHMEDGMKICSGLLREMVPLLLSAKFSCHSPRYLKFLHKNGRYVPNVIVAFLDEREALMQIMNELAIMHQRRKVFDPGIWLGCPPLPPLR